MASSLQPRKKAVDLAAPGARVSRIRRDPPPPVKVVTAADIRDRETRNIVIGTIAVALALLVILAGFNNAAGWSPSQYTITIREQG